MNSITREKFSKLSPHNRDGLSVNRVERLITTCKADITCHKKDDFSYTGLNKSDYGHGEVIAGFVYGAEKAAFNNPLRTEVELNKAASTIMTSALASANGLKIDFDSVAYRSAFELIYRHDAEDYSELIEITD